MTLAEILTTIATSGPIAPIVLALGLALIALALCIGKDAR